MVLRKDGYLVRRCVVFLHELVTVESSLMHRNKSARSKILSSNGHDPDSQCIIDKKGKEEATVGKRTRPSNKTPLFLLPFLLVS